ncbi:uncharacterized protein [Paralichthys olivaceus]|uniref:uncharacterized protein n=1 Tax=Paralichthys olivaceus TaxID=8255 RepID=UPI003751E8D1
MPPGPGARHAARTQSSDRDEPGGRSRDQCVLSGQRSAQSRGERGTQVLSDVAPTAPGPVGAPRRAARCRALHGGGSAQKLRHQGGAACGGPRHGGAARPAPEGQDGGEDGDEDGGEDRDEDRDEDGDEEGDDGGTQRERQSEKVATWSGESSSRPTTQREVHQSSDRSSLLQPKVQETFQQTVPQHQGLQCTYLL